MRYSKIALIVAIACFVFCVLYESVFILYEAPCHFFYSLGVVVNCVSLSIIASCIFYFITDYFPKLHQKNQINSYVQEQLLSLSQIGINAVVDILGKESQKDFSTCSKDLFSVVGNSVQKDSCFNQSGTWFDYFDSLTIMEDIYINRLSSFESNIPVEVKLSIVNLAGKPCIIRDTSKGRKVYNSDPSKREISAYAEEIKEHINGLSSILELYNKNSKI